MKIAYFAVAYPTLSQTFIQREVEALRSKGVEVSVMACRQWGGDEGRKIYGWNFKRCWDFLCVLGEVALTRGDLWKQSFFEIFRYRWCGFENFLANIWGVIAGLAYVKEIRRREIQLVHGIWATLPATAAVVVSRILRIPFSFGAHAYDIYRNGGDGFLKEKLKAVTFVHTTTSANVEYLRNICSQTDIILARRGLEKLPDIPEHKDPSDTVRILSVGRLISKKGHSYQLEACHILKQRKVPFLLKIAGDGVLKEKLRDLIQKNGLEDCVELKGELTYSEVECLYRWADIFWHTGIVDPQGDRDGLPNVVAEAMSYGIPVISSGEQGVSEAVKHEVTGLVVDVRDGKQLADAVERISRDEILRKKLADNARIWVEENFLISKNTEILKEAFRKVLD